jgi:hypothetical protein
MRTAAAITDAKKDFIRPPWGMMWMEVFPNVMGISGLYPHRAPVGGVKGKNQKFLIAPRSRLP